MGLLVVWKRQILNNDKEKQTKNRKNKYKQNAVSKGNGDKNGNIL